MSQTTPVRHDDAFSQGDLTGHRNDYPAAVDHLSKYALLAQQLLFLGEASLLGNELEKRPNLNR
jgi:hypothetical protein